jgi:poly(A) polymerase
MSAEVAEVLRAAPLVDAARRALGEAEGAWVVGGAVRDAALGREVADLDLAVAGDPGAAARALAAGLGEHAFELSAEFGTWRVVSAGSGWQADVTALRGGGIEADLGERDFTIGAVAVPLRGGGAIDPFGGLADLDRRLLRAVGEASFESDPLRLLRAARLAAQLELEIDAHTAELARAARSHAADPAGERQLAELRQLVGGPDPLRGLALLDELELTAVVLPELENLRGVEQGPNHHLDVHGHTLAVLGHTLEVGGPRPPPPASPARAPARSRRCWRSRSPTRSAAAPRCASAPSCTTSASPPPVASRAASSASAATTARGRRSSPASARGCAPAGA